MRKKYQRINNIRGRKEASRNSREKEGSALKGGRWEQGWEATKKRQRERCNPASSER